MNIFKYLNKLIEYGTLAFIFLIPWQARVFIKTGQINGGYWEYGTISLYATELILLVVLLAVLLKGYLYFRKNDFSWSDFSLRKGATALLLFIVWAGLSIIWSINREVAFEHWVMLVEAGVVFLLIISGAADKNKIINVFLAAAGLQAAIALAQFFWQSVPASTWLGVASQQASALGASVVETASGRFLRAYGTFPHPNILGGFLVLCLILIIERMMQLESQGSRVKGQRLILFSLYIVILFALFVTFSRSAILAFFLFTFSFLLFSKSRVIILKSLLVFLLVLTSFFALYSDLVLSRLDSGNRLAERSDIERESYLRQSWQIIKASPVLGTGIGNYTLKQYELDNSRPAWYYQPVHNVPLLVFAELGLVGIFFVSCILYLVSFRLKKMGVKFTEVCLYIAPLLPLALLDHYLWSLYPGLLMGAVYLGLTVNWPQASLNQGGEKQIVWQERNQRS